MKKVILLAFLAAGTAFTSCDKDEDDTSQDPLVGSWVQTRFTTTFDGEENEESITGCDGEETTAVFNEDGTYTAGMFEQSDGGCAMDDGIWENTGNNSYSLTQDDESTILNITFSDNTFTTVSEPNESDEGAFYTTVYQKM